MDLFSNRRVEIAADWNFFCPLWANLARRKC